MITIASVVLSVVIAVLVQARAYGGAAFFFCLLLILIA